MRLENPLDALMKFLIVRILILSAADDGLVDEEDLEAELEALGDELAMEEELKEEEGAVPR
jgi:hypothetical protein